MKNQSTKITKIMSVLMSLLMVLSVISFPALKTRAAAGTIDDFVERCYTVTLDRGSDPDGFADWKGQLLNGEAVGVHVAYGFLFSPEYTKNNKSNEDYVTDLYMLFMGREPDEEGFEDWVGQLKDGKSRVEVFAGFANSQEFYNICESYGISSGRFVIGYDRFQVNNVNLFVERLYKVCFGRLGDIGGQKNWVEKLVKKQITGSECARSFIQSQEYEDLGLSDEDYVENLYIALMGRASDAPGKADWLKKLDEGITRDQVFEGFVNSVEFDGICKTYGINRGSYKATHVCPYKVGDIIKFGKYEQDGNLSDGKEDIEWQVISVKKGKAYVVSKYSLTQRPYHPNSDIVTWETCDLRHWLNNDFYDEAFSESEKNLIPLVTVENKNNPYVDIDGGNDTEDKVFLLSLEDCETYFGEYSWYDDDYPTGYNQNLSCESTAYVNENFSPDCELLVDDSSAFKNKYGLTSEMNGRHSCQWWLRSVGTSPELVLAVSFGGQCGAGENYYPYYEGIGVRPAMYISY
ncbi:MAG: DUF4214 domain-containing protein [Lachnospiraceae bacterium]|nr:DUF4214 domain-containing protein [Lachnospiraceae bacterium]